VTTIETIKRRIAEIPDLDRIVPGRWAKTYDCTPEQITEWVREERSERVREGV